MSPRDLKADARAIFDAAVAAADPAACVARALEARPGVLLLADGSALELGADRRVWILGMGKAAVPMAARLLAEVDAAYK